MADNVLPFPSLGVRHGRSDEGASEPDLRTVFGEVLRDERQAQRRTLSDVADRAAVSVGYLSEIERGEKEPSSAVLRSVCGALDVTIIELLDRSAGRLRQFGSGGSTSFRMAA